jgi:hypothetical protein
MLKQIESIKKKRESVPISEKASFKQSVSKILFYKTEKGNYGVDIISTCSRPYYFARLTGPALVATQRMRHYNYSLGKPIEFEDVVYRGGDSSLQYLGSTPSMSTEKQVLRSSTLEFFPVHHAGTYFLEILHVVCNSTDTSLVEDCLPDSLDALTLNKAFQIELGVSTKNTTDAISWMREKKSATLEKAISTRIQTKNSSTCDTCRNDWFDNYNLRLPKLVRHPEGPRCMVCLIGASHSRHMALAMNEAFLVRQPSCHAVHFDIKFPQEYDNSRNNVSTLIETHKCTDVIVAMGQWALSWKNGKKFQSREDFKRHMINVVDSFSHHFPETRLTLRSLHYHPLSNIILSCKPSDWRSPMLTDAYNEILMQIAESHEAFRANDRLSFVDTSVVVRPVWDTPDDWSHYSPKVGVEEAIFLLNQIWDPSEKVARLLQENTPSSKAPGLGVQNMSLSLIGSLCVLMYLVLGRKAR